jgi:serine/threonine protein phosphatase PrpC
VFATHDHSLYDEAEVARITAARGQVVDKTDSGERRVIPPEAECSLDQVKAMRIALNMSRSLGHATLSRFGVSAMPDVSAAIQLEHGDWLVLATDGLSRAALSTEEIARIVCSSGTPRTACQALAAASLREDKRNHRKSDNTTVLVALYDGPNTFAKHEEAPVDAGSPRPPTPDDFTDSEREQQGGLSV